MVPRPVGRGGADWAAAIAALNAGFNGAASCWTRRGAPAAAGVRPRTSFNGAASCWTRRVWTLTCNPASWDRLQWCRVLLDAEGPLGRTDNGTLTIASMVPRPVGRGGTPAVAASTTRTQPLQWCRVLLDAEGSSAAPASGTCPGFNGAASCWTRRDRPRAPSPGAWSCFNGAASCWTRRGPTAEPPRGPRRRFNGAASCWTRRPPDRQVEQRVRRASMVPRPVGRGGRPTPCTGSRPSSCFNGAASCWTRRAR